MRLFIYLIKITMWQMYTNQISKDKYSNQQCSALCKWIKCQDS